MKLIDSEGMPAWVGAGLQARSKPLLSALTIERRETGRVYHPIWRRLTRGERARALRFRARLWQYHPAAISVERSAERRLYDSRSVGVSLRNIERRLPR